MKRHMSSELYDSAKFTQTRKHTHSTGVLWDRPQPAKFMNAHSSQESCKPNFTVLY